MPGPFHRLESPTQTIEVAIEQVASGEVWGRTPRGGMVPVVQAYPLGMPDARRGIEFSTPINPYPNGSPFEVRWYLGRSPGVEERVRQGQAYAAIPANVINRQE
jgi:hypothetical protein